MDFYGFGMDTSWFHFLGFSQEIIQTLDLLKFWLVKP